MTFATQEHKAARGLGKAEALGSIPRSSSSSVGRRPRLPGGYSGPRNTGQHAAAWAHRTRLRLDRALATRKGGRSCVALSGWVASG